MYDRFTRDEVSQWMWWPIAMVLLVLVVLTLPGENRAIDERRADVAERAGAYTAGRIAPIVSGQSIADPFDRNASSMLRDAVDGVVADPHVDIVRIWASDTTMLLWSSVPADPVGSAAGLNDPEIEAAAADPSAVHVSVVDRDLAGLEVSPTYSAYAPVSIGGDVALAQFEVPESTLLADVRTTWLGYRVTAGVAFLLVLAFALGSMRRPVARIGAGVPFYRTSVPDDVDVLEVDRRIELEQAGTHARERVANMEARLKESEEIRRKLEGDLQRTLTELATKTGAMRPAIARTAVRTEQVAPEPALVEPQVPPAPVVRLPEATSEPEPAAPPPEVVQPQTVEPEVVQPQTVEPEIVEPQIVEPGAVEPPPTESEPERQRAKVRPTTVKPKAPPAGDGRAKRPSPARPEPIARPAEPDTIVVPEAEVPMPLPASDVVRVSATDENAVEVLERLVEPVGASPVHPGEDPSVLRAKLARTAAVKKPGYRREERMREDDNGSGHDGSTRGS